jgi:ammonium transporter, Amt family
MIAGLATITPASGFVGIPAAFCIGLAGGAACYFAVSKLKRALKYDDSLDVFGVHCMGSTVGILLLGFLADPKVNSAIATTFERDGQIISLAGSTGQFLNQLIGVGFTIAFSAVATLVILWLVGLITPLRVSEEDENTGLDVSEHGESAYND